MASGHPKHPATVHFPIAFITLTGGLDVLHALASSPATASVVRSALKTLQAPVSPSALPQLSYYANIFALLSIIPAVATGIPELLPLVKKDGPFGSKKSTTAVTHALLNEITAVALAYNWWTRRSAVGFEPSSLNVALSGFFGLIVASYSAYLGGSLVYDYGMGIGRSSQSKKSQ